MAGNGMFFDSKNGDRLYDAESFRIWCRRFFTNGIFRDSDGTYGFSTSSAGGRNVTVSAGIAFINGAIKILKEPVTITVPEFTGSESYAVRNVVIDFNSDRDTRDVTIYVDNGGTTSPAAPIRNDNRYQLVIAHVNCPPTAERADVLPEDITDVRDDPDLCGFMTCRVAETDVAEIASELSKYMEALGSAEKAKYDAEIKHLDSKIDRSGMEIFGEIETVLNEMTQVEANVAGLQEKIDQLSRKVDNVSLNYKTIMERKGTCFLGDALSSMKFGSRLGDAFNWHNLKKVILTFTAYSTTPALSIHLHKEYISDTSAGAGTHLVSDYSLFSYRSDTYTKNYTEPDPFWGGETLVSTDYGEKTFFIKYDIDIPIGLNYEGDTYIVSQTPIVSTTKFEHFAYANREAKSPYTTTQYKPVPNPTVTEDFTVNYLRVIAVY